MKSPIMEPPPAPFRGAHLLAGAVITLFALGLAGCSSDDSPTNVSAPAVAEVADNKGVPLPVCGDGIVNGDEECDPNVIIGSVENCCTDECEIAPADTVCREGSGICDPAEICNGTSVACPVNQLALPGTSCDDDDLFCNGTASCDGGGTCNEMFIKCSIDSPVCDDDVDGCVGLCGDKLIGVGENCDDGNSETEPCSYGNETCDVCGETCLTVSSTGPFCGDGVLQDSEGETCDDGPANGTPGSCNATCDGNIPADEDCGNGVVDDGEVCDDGAANGTTEGGCSANCGGLLMACYQDQDGDGFGASDADVQLVLNSCPIGTSEDNTDCDDEPTDSCAATSFPGNNELCDGCDNDCDPQTPDANDEEGIGEICREGVSGSCRTGTLLCEGGALGCVCDATLDCFVDTDGDEFGTTAVVISADGGAISCLDVPGFADVGGDCDPDEPLCTTTCDDTDDDGLFDCADDCLDSDGDGFGDGAGCTAVDCDDSQSTCTDNCDQQSSAGTPCDGSGGDATDTTDPDTLVDADEDVTTDVSNDASADTSQEDISEDTAEDDGSGPDTGPVTVTSGGSGNGCASAGHGVPAPVFLALFLAGMFVVRRRR